MFLFYVTDVDADDDGDHYDCISALMRVYVHIHIIDNFIT